MEKEELTYDGFVFANAEDLEIAKNEKKKIVYIETHTDLNNLKVAYELYNKALESKAFLTPVGLEFMHQLEKSLLDGGYLKDEIKPIPLYTTFRRISLKESKPVKERLTKAEKKEMSLKMKYRNAVLISVILGLLAFAMFVITMTGSTPNVLNYKTAITNEYASWEQELTERENAVREKEKELNITSDD